MTRSQLISKVARQTQLTSAEAEKVLDSFVDNIIESLRDGDKVTIAGFGRFEMRRRKAKAFTNPKTRDKSQLEPRDIPGFKASGLMKQKLESK